ncbi:MAG: SDR family NAD(P)-dependent oxidoreductase [Hyphomicrobiales bacterium]|nr:SDR family NAD(P)-dependent oxidoreductase [Hyphomicrobiales bacterium]
MKLGKTLAAIVTGGASGLGEASARMLAGHGVKVALFDMNAARGEAVAGETGGLFCTVDVTDEASVDAGLEKARAAHGVERILVNCAGIVLGRKTISADRETGELRAHDLASFRRTIEVNLVGTYNVITRSALAMAAAEPLDDDGGRGVIVCTSSVAATEGQIGQAAYAASKGGVLGLTVPVARDLAEYGIRVVTIQPGIFETPMFDSMPDKVRDALAAGVPFPSRLGRADEYADLVRYICQSDYINGAAIRLDGALRLAPR